MCRLLDIPRPSYYYKAVEPVSEAELEEKSKRFSSKVSPDTVLGRLRNVWKYKVSTCLVVGFVES